MTMNNVLPILATVARQGHPASGVDIVSLVRNLGLNFGVLAKTIDLHS